MSMLPEFFTTQHQLRQKAVLDQGADSTLFLVEDPSHDEMLVEIYAPEHRGVLRPVSYTHLMLPTTPYV